MMAKPMKTLELHYPMIQFLISENMLHLIDLDVAFYMHFGNSIRRM